MLRLHFGQDHSIVAFILVRLMHSNFIFLKYLSLFRLMQNRPFIFLAFLTLLTLSVIDNSRGPLYPLIKTDLDLLNSQAALIFALGSLGQFVVNIFSGLWLKLTFKKSIVVFQVMMLIGCLLLGASKNLGPMFLYVGSFIFGMGSGGLGSLANMLIILGTSTERRRQFLSGLHAMYGTASFLAPFLVRGVFSFGGTWGQHFFLLSLFPFIAMMIAAKNLQGEIPPTSKKMQSDLSFWQKIPIGFLFSSYVAGEVLISSRMVVYLMDAWRFSWEAASLSLSFFFMSLLFGRALFALVKFPGKSFHWLLLSLVTTILLLVIGLRFNPQLLFLTGFSISIFFPCGIDWMTHNYGEKAAGFLTTYVSMWIGLGLVSMHILNGILADTSGPQAAMLMAPILLLCSLVIILVLSKSHKI